MAAGRNKAYWTFDWENFGRDMRIDRAAQKRSGTEFANMLGLSKATISRYENGLQTPPINEFLLICYACNLDPKDYFIDPEVGGKTMQMFNFDDHKGV